MYVCIIIFGRLINSFTFSCVISLFICLFIYLFNHFICLFVYLSTLYLLISFAYGDRMTVRQTNNEAEKGGIGGGVVQTEKETDKKGRGE